MFQKADLDKIATLTEFEGFKQTMFEKRKSYREMIDVKIKTDQQEIKKLRKQSQQYTPSMLYYDTDTVFQELYPNCYKLLYLLMIFPLSVACVERFFFFQTKTCENRVEKSIESNNFGVSIKNRN